MSDREKPIHDTQLLLISCLAYLSCLLPAPAVAAPPISNQEKSLKCYAEANYFASQNLLEQAIASLNKAIELDPKNPEFHSRKSILLFEQQDDDKEALKEIDCAISLAKQTRIVDFVYRASILERLGRFPEALQSVNTALGTKEFALTGQATAQPKRVIGKLHALRGNIYKKMGHLQDALDEYSMAIKIDPKCVDYYCDRADVNLILKKWSLVIPDATFVLKTWNKGSPFFRKRDSYLQIANSYTQLKNFNKATETYVEALKSCPDDRRVVTEAQKYFASIGDKKSAETLQKRLKALDADFLPFK